MTIIDWNIFKAKFNGREQKTFETLSYLLFCEEFNIDIGIFRYKNQVGIEAEPIEFESRLIGFQAKFYETKVSDNVQDIKDSIAKAKDKNPNLNIIFYYTNQEFSESSTRGQKEPQYKTNIEDFASEKGLEIEWRVPSHFERRLACERNSFLAKRFFKLEKSVFDLVQDLIQHTESILTPIRSDIKINGNVIKLDRSGILSNLKTVLAESSVVVLSGKGGVGKTAVIKDFYNAVKDTVPLFIFKANEFNISNINILFNGYGYFTLKDFVSEYQQIKEKYIVIDSAEKLSDIEDQSVVQEFLSALIDAKWKIIFTTRHSYLDDLRMQVITIYQLPFRSVNIEEISIEELLTFSETYCFGLPQNDRLFELLQNPFYLAEYLREYNNIERSVNLSDFKNLLWDKQILKSVYQKNNIHIRRENCFLQIAQKRANEGHLFVSAEGCDNEALQSLEADEIIKYDWNAGGYFITHDIYEEWALDKIIERSYISLVNYESFFVSLGNSLPIRRAFRSWLSDKLFIDQEDIKLFIEQSFVNDKIESFWKDEMIVSVLLSDYSHVFFRIFEAKLLEKKQEILIRIIFLLRIACKEVDEEFLSFIGLNQTDDSMLAMLFTQPKGSGWDSLIDFVYKHREMLGVTHFSAILPMLADWNNKNTQGETTRKASQIGLFYYESIVNNGGFDYRSRKENTEQLFKVILQGSAEIKEELIHIFDGIISRNEPNHHDRDYELVKMILTSTTDNFEVIKNLPEYVIKLAELFWVNRPKKTQWYEQDSPGVEKYFGLSNNYEFQYFPSSAFQTPIYQLLRFSPDVTLDFILSFTNRAVECYANSSMKGEIEEVRVFLNENCQINQYISSRLWDTYRGTGPGSPGILASMHMALEKWLLDYAESGPDEGVEKTCYNLMDKSRSASITAVVASVVISQPFKLFNIAKVLFRTKQFFFYDRSRIVLDETARITYSFGYELDFKKRIHYTERIETCAHKHRKKTLEQLTLEYQFFRSENVTAAEAEKRQKAIWEIFDEYYKELEEKPEEIEFERTWKLYLARMDRRKMNPELEQIEEVIIIKFNPQIDPELKKYSDESLQNINDANKYMPLYSWSRYRFSNEIAKYRQYQKYEENPQLVVTEIKEIIQALEEETIGDFQFSYHSTLAYACAVLISDFIKALSFENIVFCKNILIDFSVLPISEKHFFYQVSDGTEPAISSLPNLHKHFSEDIEEAEGIKVLLILLLLNNHEEISKFATQAILQNLWELSFNDAHSIFFGYLNLKPKYDNLIDEIRKENSSKGIYRINEFENNELFVEKYEAEIEQIILNKIKYDDISDIQSLDLRILTRAFELLPLGTKDPDHIKFVLEIFPIYAVRVFERDRYHDDEEKFDYTLKIRFFAKFAAFVLTADKEMIEIYIQPFVENFRVSDDMARFFQNFINVEDILNKYEEFWQVWDAFYERIKTICTTKNYYYTNEVIYTYLLAGPYWKEDIKGWHSLKEREKLFYKKVSEDIGNFPPVLYSIAKVLNDIGSGFLEDGVLWLSDMLRRNENLLSEELEVNTIYYLESIAQKYILLNRQKIKSTLQMKNAVLTILDYLVERGSATGYLLRENIL